jgi:hypothetical protein
MMINAQDVFYDWENEIYPSGNSPLSDDDRLIFMAGYAQCEKHLTNGNDLLQKAEAYMSLKKFDMAHNCLLEAMDAMSVPLLPNGQE